MSIASLVRSLAAAGATPEVIAIAVDALEAEQAKAAAAQAAEAAVHEARKSSQRERQRRSRERRMSRDGHVGVTSLSRDSHITICDPPIPPIPLNDPQPLLPTVEVNLNPKPPFIPPFPKFPKNSFEQFWSAYPNKVGKKDAKRSFERLEKSGEVTFDDLFAGVERYKVSKPEHHEWKHPATWLNRGCWTDEYAPPVPPSPPINGFRYPPVDIDAEVAAAYAEIERRKLKNAQSH